MPLPPLSSALSFLDAGNLALHVSAIIDGQELPLDNWELTLSDDGQCAYATGLIPGRFRDDLFFEFHGKHLRCRRTFTNLSDAPQKLNELKATLTGMNFNGARRDDFFYHNENPRIYEVMAFPIDYVRTKEAALNFEYDIQAGNRWADPGVICERIGRSPYQPFPALLVGNTHRPSGVVFGTLSQRQCYHNFLLSHDDNDDIVLQAFSSFKGLDYRILEPGETVTDWWYLGKADDVANVETIFADYADVLREILPPLYGKTRINRDNLVWGSWNDGISRNVSEEMLLREARFLKEHFPTVRWIQLDDGYSASQKRIAHGLGVPYEGEEGIDRQKFPQGMRHYASCLKKIGLRPALWIGGSCPKASAIYREHPQWFIDYDYRTKDTAPLDVSQEEVRRYMCSALDTLLTDYGFEGVKQDFWSYAFEDSHDLLKNKEKSGYEWRSWWLAEMRKRLPSDGYFQTGCDIVMGNPFLAEYYTNYRYGIDIGSGNWNHVKTNYLWGMACFATHTSDLFVPNSDAIGLFPGLNDTEAQFCNTYCLVTHSMVEIAGKLSQSNQDSQRFKMLKKCACNPNNGQKIFFAGWNYLDSTEKYPTVLYFRTPHFSVLENARGLPLRTIGLFNLEDVTKTIDFTLASIGLDSTKDYILINVWTGETQTIKQAFQAEVPAHGSMLLAVSDIPADGCPALLDADIRIVKAECKDGALLLENDYADAATLQFNKPLASLAVNGSTQPIPSSPVVSLNLPAHARIVATI